MEGRAVRCKLDGLKDMQKHATTVQGEYGKWMITTLYLLHAGAIAGRSVKAGTEALAALKVPPLYRNSRDPL